MKRWVMLPIFDVLRRPPPGHDREEIDVNGTMLQDNEITDILDLEFEITMVSVAVQERGALAPMMRSEGYGCGPSVGTNDPCCMSARTHSGC
ncbi:hypothetical protein [Streptomyces sp. NPDC029003]|uniref:hypothetical protein n=1 Tax=Streptomyces sp. NPDC029003 TaxID=3155125 RepID=UPI003408613F